MSHGVGYSRAVDGEQAGREAVERALAQSGGPGAAILLFVSRAHADPRAVVRAARALAPDTPLVGCMGSGVVVPGAEIEDGPGVVAMSLPRGVDARPFACLDPEGVRELGRVAEGMARGVALLLADGVSQHPDHLADAIAGVLPRGVTLAGGVALGPAGPTPAYRFLNDEIYTRGAVGLLIGGDAVVGVAQGCKPVGSRLMVTHAEGNVIARFDLEPAWPYFARHARPLLNDLKRAAQSVLLAVPGEPGGGMDDPLEHEFVVRGFLKFDPDAGLLAVSEPIPEGTMVRFAVRDGWGARAQLRAMLDGVVAKLAGRKPTAAVWFGCAGRGRALFEVEDHDIAHLQGALGADVPIAGMLGGGEIGPTRGVARLHLFSGVLVVFAS